MSNPVVKSLTPNIGDPGDKMRTHIFGDALTDVRKGNFGPGIDVVSIRVIDDGEVVAKIEIYGKAVPGPRDVTLTDSIGGSGTLPGGFQVL